MRSQTVPPASSYAALLTMPHREIIGLAWRASGLSKRRFAVELVRDERNVRRWLQRGPGPRGLPRPVLMKCLDILLERGIPASGRSAPSSCARSSASRTISCVSIGSDTSSSPGS